LANAFAIEGASYCKIFYLTNIKSFIALIPSLLLLIKVSLGEKLKSLRRQGGGVGGRAAVTPLQRRRMRQSGSLAFGKWLLVGHRPMGVVGRGSGDQNGQGTQGQQNCDSRMKNIFWELKLSVTTDWDSHHLPFHFSQIFSSSF
jgi:hypothetical protein